MAETFHRLRTALADRCTIQRELGRGRIARVCLAEEQHPKGPVAINVLDPEIVAVLGRDRFLWKVEVTGPSDLSREHRR